MEKINLHKIDLSDVIKENYDWLDGNYINLKADGIYQNLKKSLEALQKAFSDKDYGHYFKLLEER